MLEQIFQYFKSFYTLPQASVEWVIFAIGLALVYGATWVAAFWPPLFKNWRLWLVVVAAIVLPTIVLPFIQFPAQSIVSQPLMNFLGGYFQPLAINLITGVVMVIISGLIIQGVLLIPVLYYRLNRRDEFTPRYGLMVGALSGSAFGLFQAYSLFGKMVQIGLGSIIEANPLSYLAFAERFFAVALFTGTTALAGYWMAKGKGWQAFLVFAGINAVYDYLSLLMSAKMLSLWVTEIILTLISLAVVGLALWLYWKKSEMKKNLPEVVICTSQLN